MTERATHLDIAIDTDLTFYGLRAKPFQPTVDPRFLWLGVKHREGLARLTAAVQRYSGVVVLTGDAGTGKTMLANALIEGLGEDVAVASLRYPRLDPLEFYRLLARAYELDATADSREALLAQLETFVAEARRTGRKLLLVLDEAHGLSHKLFEEIRRFLNLGGRDPETGSPAVLNVLLVGQKALAGPLVELELARRVTLRWVVELLTVDEVGEYIAHRLQVAGSARNPFSAEGVREVWALSGGIPRLVNALCDRALLVGGRAMAMGSRCASLTIGPDIIGQAASELGTLDPRPGRVEGRRKAVPPPVPASGARRPRRAAAIVTGLILVSLSVAVAGYVRWPGQGGSAPRTEAARLAADVARDTEAPAPVAQPIGGPAKAVTEAAEPIADLAKIAPEPARPLRHPPRVIPAPGKRLPATAKAGEPTRRPDMKPPATSDRPVEPVGAPRARRPARAPINGKAVAGRRPAVPVPRPAPVTSSTVDVPVPSGPPVARSGSGERAEPDPTAVIDWLLDEYAAGRR